MTRKPPDLELIEAERLERRRLPRLNLTTEQFRISSIGKIFSVTDLSEDGMALRILEKEDFEQFPLAGLVEGILNFRREKHPVKARVRRLSGDKIGCQFENISDAVKGALRSFLDPEALGRELKPIPSSERSALWYHGPSGTDLVLWRATDGQYRKLTLFVLGSFIQWDSVEGLSTGSSESSEQRDEEWGIVRFETLLMNPDFKPNLAKLRIAKTLILSSNLPQDLKKWCVRQLELNA